MSEPAAPAPAPKSGAQERYDRMRLQCNRFNAIRKRLDKVRSAIASGETARPHAEAEDVTAAQKPRSFLAGLDALLDANDRIADMLDACVEDLAALF